MWTRKELKDRAKAVLKPNYWRAVLVALILVLVSSGGGGGSAASSINSSSYDDPFDSINDSFDDNPFDSINDSFDPDTMDMAFIHRAIAAIFNDMSITDIALFISAFAVILIVIFAIALALSVFVYHPLVVGCQRFFLRCREEEARIGEVTYVFSHSYLNVVKITFLQGLYTFLWTLLLIVPGIIKAYEYRMIPYILAENPDMDSKAVFARTKEMMTGEKWNTFVLDLSFLGWLLLSLLTCFILNVFYVNPYSYLTYAELYAVLKRKVDGAPYTYYGGNVYMSDEARPSNPYVQY